MADTIVKISEGKIRGTIYTTPNGKTYYGFMGIPYAESPTGPLRFKDPIPVQNWPDIKDVTEEKGFTFAQYEIITNTFVGTETLTLNVYTPTILNTDTKLLPVMVFIHGGGFIMGTSEKAFFGPDYLVERDVVVVTVQYRLGVFGFLCLDLPDAPGNAGLKDQVLALQWVQRNIRAFNGDSSNVTIFGTSAGGASVEYHILSPMSKNLFHKAIGHSGSTLNPWAFNANPKKTAIELGKILGKNTQDSKELLDYFVSLPLNELASGANKLFKKSQNILSGGLNFIFVPTVEKKFDNVSHFLTENPLQIIKSNRQNNVPFITGYAEKEGLVYDKMVPFKFEALLKSKQLTNCLPFQIEDESFKMKINEYYLKRDSMEDNVITFLGDMDFKAGITVSAKLQCMENPNVYLYDFKHDGELNSVKNFMGVERPGATHADQEGYISSSNLGNLKEGTPTDKLVRERVLQMWTNFAKTGNPTPKTTAEVPITWRPIEKERLYCLNIDKDLTLEVIPNDKWTSLWERVHEYPQK